MNVIPTKCNLCNGQSFTIIFEKNGYQLYKCQLCELVFVGNPPTFEELKKIYSFESDYHTGFRDDSILQHTFKTYAEENFKLIKKYISEGRLLDVGCSAGFFLAVAKEHGLTSYGLELSKDTAELANSLYKLEVKVGTLDDNLYDDNFFNIITLWDVIEHVHNPNNTMRTINKLLMEEGIVVIATPNIDGLFPKLSYYASKIIGRWLHPEPPYHLYQFSISTLEKLFLQTGFEVLAVHHGSIPVSYTFGILKSLLKSPLRLFYALIFAPTVLLGPVFNSGDWIVVVGKKKSTL